MQSPIVESDACVGGSDSVQSMNTSVIEETLIEISETAESVAEGTAPSRREEEIPVEESAEPTTQTVQQQPIEPTPVITDTPAVEVVTNGTPAPPLVEDRDSEMNSKIAFL